jgi:outer membrane protein assembly factor BamD (BamD/ComL family)
MNNLGKLFALITLVALCSCKGSKAYKDAINNDSIGKYEYYINSFPHHKNAMTAKANLSKLYEERDWDLARSGNIIQLQNFINTYANSQYISEAKLKIEQLTEKDSWERAKRLNSVKGFEIFLSEYPKSKYKFIAKTTINELKEKNDWEMAKSQNTVETYSIYKSKYPYGKYGMEANDAIRQIEIITPAWLKAQSANTKESYEEFLLKHNNSSYSDIAQFKLRILHEQTWENVKELNTIRAYETYLEKYPLGDFSEDAEKRIIDLEVDAIFSGDHGKLPPMSKTSKGYSKNTTIKVKNDTEYTLTIRYSGRQSKKIILLPRTSTTATIANGAYRVAASVNASNVGNYAGKETLSGGTYESSFYIKTYQN